MSGRRAVLIDALGTLVGLEPPAPALRDALRERTGTDVGLEAAERGFGAEITYYLEHHLEGGDRVRLEGLRDACAHELQAALGVAGLDHAAVRAAMIAALRFTAYPDVVPALGTLRARGLRVVVVSNWDCSLPDWLADAGLAELIDGTISSAAVGVAKPAPEPFLAALELAGVEAAQALHVGDSPVADVEGAAAVGIDAVLLDRDRAHGDRQPTIASLDELVSLI